MKPYLVVFIMVLMCPTMSLAEAQFSQSPGFLLSPPANDQEELRISTDISYIGGADFTNGLGRVDVVRSSLTANYSIFELTYGLSHFNWEDKRAVTFSEGGRAPWNDLHDVTLQAHLLNNSLGDGWRYWVNGALSAAFEQDFPGAVGLGFDGGVAYDFWNGWMIGLTGKTVALSALSQDLFGDMELGLALAVSQKTLRAALKSLGLYRDAPKGAENIGFSIALSGAEKTYRLAPDSPVRNNGYLSLVRSKIGAYLDYTYQKQWTLTVGPEYNYARKYKVYDSSGKLHSSHDLESAWGGYARIQYRF